MILYKINMYKQLHLKLASFDSMSYVVGYNYIGTDL